MGLEANVPKGRSVKHVELAGSRDISGHCLELIVQDFITAKEELLSKNATEAFKKIVKKRKKKQDNVVRVDLSHCKYDVLRIVIKKLGWLENFDESKQWHLYWTDNSIGPERLGQLRSGQKVNHFFGMLQICRKKSLARHLMTMRKMFPADYRFFPRAFILPTQLHEFYSCFNSAKQKTYILKPDTGSQGRGVVLVQSIAEARQVIGGFSGPNMLAQKYLSSPMLLNGFKFDLRIYTLILSCDPLRLYLYREGLVRFCTEKYMKPARENLKHSCMHLTNYSLNKFNPNFEFNLSAAETDKGSKWSLNGLFRMLTARGYDIKKLKRQINKMVVMTLLAITPSLAHNYRSSLNKDDDGHSCFELLGMDVLVDERCKPWLLEVNHSPSFSIDTPLDLKVKEALISDTLKLVSIDPSKLSKSSDKSSKLRLYGKLEKTKPRNPDTHQNDDTEPMKVQKFEDYELLNMGNFDRIYPSDDVNLQKLYNTFLAGSEEAFRQSFDMKVKEALAKVQDERRQEELERENEEKKKLEQRDSVKKRVQESAKLISLSRQLSYSSGSVDGCESPVIITAGNAHSPEVKGKLGILPQPTAVAPLQPEPVSRDQIELPKSATNAIPVRTIQRQSLQNHGVNNLCRQEQSFAERKLDLDGASLSHLKKDRFNISISGEPFTRTLGSDGRPVTFSRVLSLRKQKIDKHISMDMNSAIRSKVGGGVVIPIASKETEAGTDRQLPSSVQSIVHLDNRLHRERPAVRQSKSTCLGSTSLQMEMGCKLPIAQHPGYATQVSTKTVLCCSGEREATMPPPKERALETVSLFRKQSLPLVSKSSLPMISPPKPSLRPEKSLNPSPSQQTETRRHMFSLSFRPDKSLNSSPSQQTEGCFVCKNYGGKSQRGNASLPEIRTATYMLSNWSAVDPQTRQRSVHPPTSSLLRSLPKSHWVLERSKPSKTTDSRVSFSDAVKALSVSQKCSKQASIHGTASHVCALCKKVVVDPKDSTTSACRPEAITNLKNPYLHQARSTYLQRNISRYNMLQRSLRSKGSSSFL